MASPPERRAVGRIQDRATFRALRHSRDRARVGPIAIARARGGESPRVAYGISRHVGGAVARNRLRRRLRAVMPELCLAPGAYLVTAQPEAVTLTTNELKTMLIKGIQLLDARGGAQ